MSFPTYFVYRKVPVSRFQFVVSFFGHEISAANSWRRFLIDAGLTLSCLISSYDWTSTYFVPLEHEHDQTPSSMCPARCLFCAVLLRVLQQTPRVLAVHAGPGQALAL